MSATAGIDVAAAWDLAPCADATAASRDALAAAWGLAATTLAPRIVRAADDPALLAGYHALRRQAFVEEQGLFAAHDRDAHDDAPSTRVLIALGPGRAVLGGVRLHPVGEDPGLGWWQGSRLVCRDDLGRERGTVGAALVQEACRQAHNAGALRFDAQVQQRYRRFFLRLGWDDIRAIEVAGAPHRLMRWPVGRIQALADATKAPLGALLAEALQTPPGWEGDDGVPVPGSGVVAAVDAILPTMVADDPWWAGWCGMLVTAHDLAAMGAAPSGALDALGARDVAHAARVLDGLRAGADALGLPLRGGHTTLGVAGSLSVTGLGHAADPVPAGGGAPGDVVTLTADLGGSWRPGYGTRQWDSSTSRSRDELAAMLGAVRAGRPRAAKDVSMAGTVGTLGMLAEASGCAAELDVAAIPRPADVGAGDWLTCFPGFGMLTADAPGRALAPAGPAVSAACGRLVAGAGVRLRWPDGDVTTAIAGPVTGLGATTR